MPPWLSTCFSAAAWLLAGCALDVAHANELSQERLNSGGWRGYSRDGITSTCQDEVLNGDEEGIDCGGSCAPCPTCTDGVKNGDEEGIDAEMAQQSLLAIEEADVVLFLVDARAGLLPADQGIA